jgi:hypothetical protein
MRVQEIVKGTAVHADQPLQFIPLKRTELRGKLTVR